jgi:hypothetical protein
VEEVIDVVGDFGPGPSKQEETSFAVDNESFGFDVTTSMQADELQTSQMLLQQQIGEIKIKITDTNDIYNLNSYFFRH